MKFTVAQSALSTALTIVSKGLNSTTMPILSGILLRADEGTLELQTTDLTISVRHKIAANIEEPGETVIPGKMLQTLVRNLPDAAISFEEMEHTVVVRCGKSTYRLNTLSPRDFPDFPEYDLAESVELPKDVLAEMVDKVYKVTSKDKGRPLLQGILLTVENNTLRLVATDSFRLAVCDTSVETSSLEGAFEMIIPGTSFHDVLTLPTDSPSVLVGSAASQIVFVLGNTTYIARKIEGQFPNFRQLLPSSCNTSAQLPLEDLAGALRRVSVIASANPSIRFDVDADGQLITLSAISPEQGEVREEIDCAIEGQTLMIGLNYHYVQDCVSAVNGQKELTLELLDSSHPGVFKSYDKINYLYLVMPVRM